MQDVSLWRRSWRWQQLRKKVLAEEGWRCYVCGKRANAVDHLVSAIERPDLFWVRSNLRAICTPCNSRKELQRREWAKRIDRRPANRRVW